MEKTIKKIAILGAESTGKSTLCEQLAAHYNGQFVPEFARSYFEGNDIKNYSLDELILIANHQLELEKDIEETSTNFLFCDTSLITIKIWALNQFNKVPHIISRSIKPSDYDLYLICNNDIPWQADALRQHQHLREHIFKWNKHELQKLSIDYHIVKGLGDKRLNNAIQIIDAAFAKAQ